MRDVRIPCMRLSIYFAGIVLLAGALSAGEKKLMHCFAFTPIETASDADWQSFFKATDALPGKVPGLTKVWYGKLRGPLSQYSVDAESRKKLVGGAKSATAEVSRAVRSWGVCMEMNDAATLKAYTANPAHKQWEAAYEKVRVEGTTTFDILGQ